MEIIYFTVLLSSYCFEFNKCFFIVNNLFLFELFDLKEIIVSKHLGRKKE